MLVEGLLIGSKNVYTINPDTAEHHTAYRGSEFNGNAIFIDKNVGIMVNGTDKLSSEDKVLIYIADNYFYQFDRDTRIGEVIAVVPNLGVSESTVSATDVPIISGTETGQIVSHTLSASMGELISSTSTIELSCIITNTANQNGTGSVRLYVNGVLYNTTPISINSSNSINYFEDTSVTETIAAESTIHATVEMSKDGNVVNPIELLIRKST